MNTNDFANVFLLGSDLRTVLRNFLGNEDTPSRVTEVKADIFSSRPMLEQDDIITLFGPKTTDDKDQKKYYEIAITKPGSVSGRHLMSLFRSEDLDASRERYNIFHPILSTFVALLKECSISSLQKICDSIVENPSWNIAHLAAIMGYMDLFDIQPVQDVINEVDCNGVTSLMVAVRTNNVKLVQKLISLNASLAVSDNEHNSLYHHAAETSKEVITILAEKKADGLNSYNSDGFTPFHLACKLDKYECILAFISIGVNVNMPYPSNPDSTPVESNIVEIVPNIITKLSPQEMKHGGNPLHWAMHKDAVEALVKGNCDLHLKNFDKRTPLHNMVAKQKFECVVALLAKGAELNTKDMDGNTPLHLAAKEANMLIVQALLVFGADIHALNNEGATVRHLIPVKMSNSSHDKILYILNAIGAKRCSQLMSGCKESCSYSGHYNGVPEVNGALNESRDPVTQMLFHTSLDGASLSDGGGRLLCLDGGGLKGLLLVQMLLKIEEVFQRPIVDCFDYIAGTSTGGILALGLSKGLTLRECQRVYFRIKDEGFVGIRPYSDTGFEALLKEVLGTDTLMRNFGKSNIMVMATRADQKPVDLHLFRTYPSPTEILKPVMEADNLMAWEAARATGAAPTYFRSFGKFIDGGLIATNPTLDALSELIELHLAYRTVGNNLEAAKAKPRVVISLGTGMAPVEQLTSIDVFKPESIWDTARLASGITALISTLVDQVTMADGRIVERAQAWCASIGSAFVRLCPRLSKPLALDEKDPALLIPAMWETYLYAHNHTEILLRLEPFIR